MEKMEKIKKDFILEWEHCSDLEKKFEDFQNLDDEEQDIFLKNLEKTGEILEGEKPEFYFHDETEQVSDFLDHYKKRIWEIDPDLTIFETLLILKKWSELAKKESSFYSEHLFSKLEDAAISFCRANRVFFRGNAEKAAIDFLEEKIGTVEVPKEKKHDKN